VISAGPHAQLGRFRQAETTLDNGIRQLPDSGTLAATAVVIRADGLLVFFTATTVKCTLQNPGNTYRNRYHGVLLAETDVRDDGWEWR